jgi:ABC-2 type transport system ATP-binding protein
VARADAVLRRVSFVSETPAVYREMSAGAFFRFLRGFYPNWDQPYLYELLKRFDLPLDTRIRDMSRGMATKVTVIAALAHRPEFLVLDDPTIGLDAVVLEEFFDTLREVSKREGTTTLIASHNIDQLEPIASHAGFLYDGRVPRAGSLEELRRHTFGVEVRSDRSLDEAESIPDFRVLERGEGRLRGVVLDSDSGAVERLRALGIERLEIRPLSLREIFVQTMRGRP